MTRETLVLLPGMMCDERLFAPQIVALHGHVDVIVERITGHDTIRGLATDVLARIPEGPFSLAGLSMGGIVALEMVRQANARVRRLALLDTNHRAEPPERRHLRDEQVRKVKAGELRQVIVEEMKPNYLASANRGNQALLDLLIDMAIALGAETFVSQSQALRDRDDYSVVLLGYDRPTLVLHGAEDTLCPPERHAQIASLLKTAMLIAVPEAGHISTLENPRAVNAALIDWLGEDVS